jgi:hypothetical protein
MLASKVKGTTVCLLALGLLGTGAGLFGYLLASVEATPPKPRTALAEPGGERQAGPKKSVHALIPVNLSRSDPKTLKFDIKLEPAKERQGTVIGPDGKPLAGARVAGLTAGRRPQILPTAKFAVRDMMPGTAHLLVFLHEKKHLGKLLAVRGKEDKAVRARLEPLGSCCGRLVDGDGKPLGARRMVALIELRDSREFVNLPHETLNQAGVYGISPGAWHEFTARRGKTDRDGRFMIEGLLPGAEYRLAIAEGDSLTKPLYFLKGKPVSVQPGKTRDLGNVVGNDNG